MINNYELRNIPNIGSIDHIDNENKIIHINYKAVDIDWFYLVTEYNFSTGEAYGFISESTDRWDKFNISDIRKRGLLILRDNKFEQCKFKDIDVLHRFDPNSNLKRELAKRVKDIENNGYFKIVFDITNDLCSNNQYSLYEDKVELVKTVYGELGVFAFLYYNFHKEVLKSGYSSYSYNGYTGNLSHFNSLPIHQILVKLYEDAKVGDIYTYSEVLGLLTDFNMEFDTQKKLDLPKIENGKLIYVSVSNENYRKITNMEHIDGLDYCYKIVSDDSIKSLELFFKQKIIGEIEDV